MQKKWFWILIFSASALSLITSFFTGQRYYFLIWNIFLALVPLIIARVFIFIHFKWKVVLWIPFLAFFPNTIYVWTDIIHPFQMVLFFCNGDMRWNGAWNECSVELERKLVAPVWTGTLEQNFAILTVLFAIAACLYSAFIAWRLMTHSWLTRYKIIGALIVSMATAFGILLGRFARTNSWEIISNPQRVWQDINWTWMNLVQDIIFQVFFLISFFLTVLVLLPWQSWLLEKCITTIYKVQDLQKEKN